ncbi:35266_t:CDS:1, partial [Gigaspora margarita]
DAEREFPLMLINVGNKVSCYKFSVVKYIEYKEETTTLIIMIFLKSHKRYRVFYVKGKYHKGIKDTVMLEKMYYFEYDSKNKIQK